MIKSLLKGTQITSKQTNTINSEYDCSSIRFNSNNALFNGNIFLGSDGIVYCYDKNSSFQIIDKKGITINKFNSIYDFIYKVFYEAERVQGYSYGKLKLDFVPTFSEVYENANQTFTDYSSYYDESRDVISATASVINKKLESGDITDETEGVISVGMVGNAVKDIAGVADGALADTVITDVALPTQVTADKTATDAGVKTPGNISAAFSQAGNAIMQGGATLGDKFPFDAIKAVTKWLQTLVQPGKPLVIDFQYDIPIVGTVDVHLDYSDKQKEVDIINWLVIVMVCLGCYAVTRDRLKTI